MNSFIWTTYQFAMYIPLKSVQTLWFFHCFRLVFTFYGGKKYSWSFYLFEPYSKHIHHFGQRRVKWKNMVQFFPCIQFRANTIKISNNGNTKLIKRYVLVVHMARILLIYDENVGKLCWKILSSAQLKHEQERRVDSNEGFRKIC